MKKIVPLCLSMTLILIAGIFAGAGTFAIFSDTETSKGNKFTAGTLDLKVGGSSLEDDPKVFHITLGPIKPGDGMGGAEHGLISYLFKVKNAGTLDGKLIIKIVNVKNYENGRNEPERKAGDTGAPGELGQYLIMQINWPGGPGFYYSHHSCGPNYCAGNGRGHTINCWENKPMEISGYVLTAGATDTGVLEFMLPLSVGNVIQSDSVKFDIVFYLEQA